jgi:hypothetical protein
MKTITILSLFAVLMFFTPPVFARRGPITIDEQIAKMTSQLNLTKDQATAIKPIMERTKAKYQKLMQNRKDGKAIEGSFPAQQQLRNEENEQFGKIFTPDQMSQWLKIENEQVHGSARKK